MSFRYLLGPVTASRGSQWQTHRRLGLCRTFHPSGDGDIVAGHGDSWDQVLGRLPPQWRPDVLVLDPAYNTVPGWLWDAPVPIVALAPDWPLQWHYLREVLPCCELVLTDAAGVDTMRQAGIPHVARANLFGLQGIFAGPPPLRDARRDIDVLFVGNLHPAVQRERLAWLGRLSRLSPRWGVHIATQVHGEDYLRLLRRARIVFNRSMRGEWNLRVGEACSAGALLFAERGNVEMAGQWDHGRDCVLYGEDDLEDLLEHYLMHEPERQAIAREGQARAREWTFDAFWEEVCRTIGEKLDEMRGRVAGRPVLSPTRRLLARTWQALSSADGGDVSLSGDLDQALSVGGKDTAVLGVAGGVARALRLAPGGQEADRLRDCAGYFHRTLGVAPNQAVAALGLVETLAALDQRQLAEAGAERLLHRLTGIVEGADLEGPPYPTGYTLLRVEWERAAWANVGSPRREAQAKIDLLRWRLHALLGSLTGDLKHYHEAALARPDLPATRAALGCALARAGRLAESVPHLELTSTANPFDRAAARALYQALIETGHAEKASLLRTEQLGLHLAAPGVVPPEPWFTLPPAASATGPSFSPSEELVLLWQGPFRERHSLAGVNRALCGRLIRRGYELSLTPVATPGPMIPHGPAWEIFSGRLAKPLSRPPDIEVRHSWPPDLSPPEGGHWVVIQPWEYGSVPRDWVGPLRDLVDELWVPTAFVRDAFVRDGVPADRVVVIPNGVDTEVFHLGVTPLTLPTSRAYKFLFVGGTIPRKGIDVLLAAFAEAFTASDDVCLVVKDMGGGSFYHGQTAGGLIEQVRARPDAPEIIHLEDDLEDDEMAALYRACDCLAHSYRGEGFGLPIAEAMACGLPVIVTDHGSALDFCDESNAYLIPARVVRLPERCVPPLETVDFPTLAEPDAVALAAILRHVVAHPDEARQRGESGRRRVVERLTWDQVTDRVERQLRELRGRPIRRFSTSRPGRPGERPAVVHGHGMELHDPARDRHLSAPLTAGRAYKPFETDLAVSLLREGDTAIDVGANVGHFTLLFARRVGPTGKVFAFEPDPDNFALLQENVRANGHRNVVLVQKAVADASGRARLYLNTDHLGDHRLYDSGTTRPSIVVEAVRLDDYFPTPPPRLALVKLDIQGAEGLALAGMRGLLRHCPAVKLIVQFWPLGLQRAGGSARDFTQGLRERGFGLHVISETRREVIRVDPETLVRDVPRREEAFTHLLCIREGPTVKADRPPLVPAKALLPGVSLSMIVKNEEHNLGDCLESAQGLFDEIVVLDTGSTDRTREIAQAHGAKVFEFPWIDHFAEARNASLGHCGREWVFWLDADDRLDEENRRKLRKLFGELPKENVCYSVKCVCPSPEGETTQTVVDHVRLFRNDPRIRWRYRIHEQILGSVRDAGGEVRWSDVAVRHIGYADPSLKGRKRVRDLRLLQMEHADQPHDPFTLFNLGATYQETGRPGDALPLLRESLARSHPSDSIVRKLYSLIALSQLNLGESEGAIQTCRAGQNVCPDDPELLFLETLLLTDTGDLQGAKAAAIRLLGTQSGPHFASVTDGLRGYRGRHQLAVICSRLGEYEEAESMWRAVLRERPDMKQAWLDLGALYLMQRRWPEFQEVSQSLSHLPAGEVESILLASRAHRVRREFAQGRRLLGEAQARWPEDVRVSIHLSHILLEEDHDPAEAERVLLEVLEREPGNEEARSNLELLRRRMGSGRDAAFLGNVGLGQLYQRACQPSSEVSPVLPALYTLARDCPLVTLTGGCDTDILATLLFAQPDSLVCYGATRGAQLDLLRGLRGSTDLRLEAEATWGEIEATDLLVIDAQGMEVQALRGLLALASGSARHLVAVVGRSRTIHEGEGPATGWAAVEEVIGAGLFRLRQSLDEGAGLRVLGRG